MVNRVRGTVVYYEGEGDEAVRVSVDDPKLSDLPDDVQEQESIQELVYDDKDEDDDETVRARHTTQVEAGGELTEEERREGAAEATAPAKSSKKGKDS